VVIGGGAWLPIAGGDRENDLTGLDGSVVPVANRFWLGKLESDFECVKGLWWLRGDVRD
jgi:hypothetical protein